MLMSQLPQDPASGAPRSDRTVSEFLAKAGFRVRCLATTATEQRGPGSALGILRMMGVMVRTVPGESGARAVHRFEQRGIAYTLLDTGEHNMDSWMREHNAQFDALLERMIAEELPEVTYVYGGVPEERARRKRLRDAGSIVVFTLHNWGYLDARAFEDIDLVLTPSQFSAEKYREEVGVDSTVAPIPILEGDVVPAAAKRRPTFVTFINPTHDKGVSMVARIAEDLCSKRGDIPFMIINARETAANLVRAGAAGGYDLRRHRQIVYSEGVPRPAEIYALTKVLLVPSVWPEPSGRVTAEGMMCGIPTLVSDRGGVFETSRGAAFCLPLPGHLQSGTVRPVSSAEARPWVGVIEKLFDDPAEYAAVSARSLAAGEYYGEERLTKWYAELFGNVVRRAEPVVG